MNVQAARWGSPHEPDLDCHVVAPLGMVVVNPDDLRPSKPMSYFTAEAIANPTPHDHVGDFKKPLGTSLNTCFACNHIFRGIPERIACFVCSGRIKSEDDTP